jgi:ABC-type dipeptide/oligopeptide/nickel transport system permease subunit
MTSIAPTVASPTESGAPDLVARGAWEDFSRRLRHDRLALAAAVFLVLLVFAAVVGAPLSARLTGHGPNEQFESALSIDGFPLGIMQRAYDASGTHHDPHGQLFVLGSDRLGRDALVRVLYGARVSLIVAFGATSLAILIGLILGLTAGYYGGRLDAVVSRLVESAMAFPALLLAVGLAVVIGPGLTNVLLVIALFSWFYTARVVRANTRTLKSSQFVEAARSVGGSDRHIIGHHILPHLSTPLIVIATSVVATNILFEAGLSYLGVGVPLPTASWGSMLSDGVTSGYYRLAPALALVPGVALVLTMLALNLLGDGLRDALDPRSANR